MGKLILVRHGESEWNKKGLWTGFTDVQLTAKGRDEAKKAGQKIKGIRIDLTYTSSLIRSKQTLEEIKNVLGIDVPNIQDKALNERDYGVYTGKDKWEIKKEVGKEEFHNIRRGWDVPIKNGESLKDVYYRTVPYLEKKILPKLKEGKNILISAHGNSLRALVKHLDNLSEKEIENLEIPTGGALIYEINSNGSISKIK